VQPYWYGRRNCCAVGAFAPLAGAARPSYIDPRHTIDTAGIGLV
jgi:hypothetical protein